MVLYLLFEVFFGQKMLLGSILHIKLQSFQNIFNNFRVFGPAWLAYGHSFALENEHDQAMAAYFKACQLMKGYLIHIH